MKDLASIQRLFTYNDWANRETLRSLERCEAPPDVALQRMGHLIGAEEIWFERMAGYSPLEEGSVLVWPKLALDECRARLESMNSHWFSFFESLADEGLEVMVEYTNSKGTLFSNSRHDILLHLFAHGAYHRGQIASDLRNAGCTPAVTDFVFSIRDGVID